MPNPYAKRIKQPVTINPNTATVEYFKKPAAETVMKRKPEHIPDRPNHS